MKVFVGYAVYSEVMKKFIRIDLPSGGYQYASDTPEVWCDLEVAKGIASPKALEFLSGYETYKVVSIYAES